MTFWPQLAQIIGAKSSKNIDWPGPKKHGVAKAQKTIGGHIMNYHMVAGAESARHHVVRGGQRPSLMMWPPIVFGALATPCFLGFGQSIFFELLVHIILEASWGQKFIFHGPPCTGQTDQADRCRPTRRSCYVIWNDR